MQGSVAAEGMAGAVLRRLWARYAEPAAFAGILALALVLRAVGIGAESLWLDEATSLVVAQASPADIVALTAADIHPPLYYWLLHVWLVFGQSEAAIRSLSAAIGILSVACMYGLGRQLAGRRAGELAALFLAVAPLHIWYSQEARMYGLATLWAIVSTWLLVVALRKDRWPAWAGYTVAVALGMYTHYYVGFIVAAQVLFVAYGAVRRQIAPVTLIAFGVAQAGWILLFAPWVPTVISQLRAGGGEWVAQAVGRPDVRTLGDTLIGFAVGPAREFLPAWPRRLAYVIFLLLGVLPVCSAAFRPSAVSVKDGLKAALQTRRAALWLALAWGVVPIAAAWLISQVKPMYTLRYLLPCLPAFCLLLALGLTGLPRRARWAGMLPAAALLLIQVWAAGLMLAVPQKADWRSATAYVVAESQAGDVVMPEPFWNAKPLRYYAGDRLALFDGAPLPATADGVAAAVEQAAAGRERLWLIEDVGHYGDDERLLATYLNAHYPRIMSRQYAGIGEIALYQVGEAP